MSMKKEKFSSDLIYNIDSMSKIAGKTFNYILKYVLVQKRFLNEI